jgi:hypothetical protein
VLGPVRFSDPQTNTGVPGELDQIAIENDFLVQADRLPDFLQIARIQAGALQAALCVMAVRPHQRQGKREAAGRVEHLLRHGHESGINVRAMSRPIVQRVAEIHNILAGSHIPGSPSLP